MEMKKAGVAIVVSDKTDFKTKTITKDKKDPAISLLRINLKKAKPLI